MTAIAVKEKLVDSEYEWHNCRSDKAFKIIMLNEDNQKLLRKLLELILKTKITDLTVLNNEYNQNNTHVKDMRTDINLDTDKGRMNIELNSFDKPYVNPRNYAYASAMYATGTLSGDEYNEDTDYNQINLTYGLMLNKDGKPLKKIKSTVPFNVFKPINEFYSPENDYKYKVNNFTIYDVNMDYFMNLWYSQDIEKIKENKLLIMLGLNREELKKFAKMDGEVKEYMDYMDKINKDPKFISMITAEDDQRKIHNSELRYAKEVGLEQGIKQGIEQGIEQGKHDNKIEIAKNLLKMNMSIEDIIKATNLDIEEIKNIQEIL